MDKMYVNFGVHRPLTQLLLDLIPFMEGGRTAYTSAAGYIPRWCTCL